MAVPVQTEATTRERIVVAAAELFRRQGYAGTGLKQVVTEAQAPFGSLYHHFPGGKEALADEVLRTGGAFFLTLYQAFVQAAPDYTAAVDDFFAGAAQTLVATGYQDACPIATVAGEVASANETLRLATADVFESWLEEMARDLRRAGAPAARAPAVALSVLALLEGAFLLSRAQRSTAALEAAGTAAVALVREATAASGA